MKLKGNKKIVLIVVWQGILTLFWLSWWTGNIIPYPWADFVDFSALSPVLIAGKIELICSLIFIPVAISSSIGLLWRRDWGRRLSVLSFGLQLPLIFLIIALTATSPVQSFWDILVPILCLAGSACVFLLPIVYLTKSKVKRIFQGVIELSSVMKWRSFILVLGIPVILTVLLPIGIRYGSTVLDDTRNKQITELSIANMEENEHLWDSGNITDYRFTLTSAYGGYGWWEGFGGISYGGERNSQVIVEVQKGGPVSVIDKETGQLIDPSTYCYAGTIPDLFSIVGDLLKGNINNDVETRINHSSDLKKIANDTWDIPISIEANYNEMFGYPERISVYKRIGTSNDYYQIQYLITYFVSDFTILWSNSG